MVQQSGATKPRRKSVAGRNLKLGRDEIERKSCHGPVEMNKSIMAKGWLEIMISRVANVRW